jgi:Xaa-Pro aminopeptidase
MINTRLVALRQKMMVYGFNGYFVPSSDEYLSEYTPASAKRLEYITGFTGSNGLALILENTVLFFTDGRYITQALGELDDHLFEIYDQQLIPTFPWHDFIDENAVIAYDPKLFTNPVLQKFPTLNLKDDISNLIDEIWIDQPKKPSSQIFDYPVEYAGQSRKDKIQKCRCVLEENKAQALVISDPASVCWLLNIRASDVEFSPLLLANMIITNNESYLFSDETHFEKGLIRDGVIILPPHEISKIINNIQGSIIFDENQCSSYLASIIKQKPFKPIKNPCMLWKACKNNIEIEHMKQGHIQDAVAVCEMLSFIANEDISSLTEYDLGLKLTDFRKIRQGYIYDSFPSIIGFQENGAIIHYRAKAESAKKINQNGLLLIDSGGQYWGATTDITRTMLIGNSKEEYKKFYTKVLKGHIALAMAKFPESKVSGANLDILARQYLWQEGLDYAHGTGHGVGSFLSVHEGPQNISLNGYGAQIKAGMIVSNEPGYYLPGEFGIRIENLMFVKESTLAGFLEFEMLTLVPYEKELIDFNMLSGEEYAYLKTYYQSIESKILPLLTPQAKEWLKKSIELPDLL